MRQVVSTSQAPVPEENQFRHHHRFYIPKSHLKVVPSPIPMAQFHTSKCLKVDKVPTLIPMAQFHTSKCLKVDKVPSPIHTDQYHTSKCLKVDKCVKLFQRRCARKFLIQSMFPSPEKSVSAPQKTFVLMLRNANASLSRSQ